MSADADPPYIDLLAHFLASLAWFSLITLISHSKPSCRPSPFFAEQAWICHSRSRIVCRLSPVEICDTRPRATHQALWLCEPSVA
jgi:hypothetical protein